ncbi:MAG: O-antigen ligase family protein [Dehalococcoidia bacterium]|nr:O-antigen ligase family protein [Dehalococcoidia bacterium]
MAGIAALFIPALLGAAALVAIAPWRFALVLMVVGIVLEPNPPDFTAPLANLVWAFPQGVNPPLTISPFECLLLVTAASLMIRSGPLDRPGLPRVAWVIPAVIIFGMAWGFRAGAPDNLVYHEARGLIFGLVAFVIAWRMPAIERETALRWLVVASTGLAAVILARYLFVIRPGYDAPLEFAFAHEDAVFLALAFVLGALMFVRAEQLPARLFFVLHNVIVLAALFGSSRRAATLALIVGLATVAWVMLPRRPVLVIGLGVPIFLVGLLYVGAYWNQEYGAMAQPARAIRSQISPSERDASSDMYRATELYNVEQTIRLNRPFGIGFGMPFYQFQPLPDLGGLLAAPGLHAPPEPALALAKNGIGRHRRLPGHLGDRLQEVLAQMPARSAGRVPDRPAARRGRPHDVSGLRQGGPRPGLYP